MDDKSPQWRSTEVLAFTEREGPGRPPPGPSAWMTCTLAGVVGVTFLGIIFSDTLCPDHRAWIEALGGFAFLAICAAFVALWRGWAIAPLLTLAASLAGVWIGLLDAAHSPTRGRLVAVGFGLATVIAAVMAWRAHDLSRWDRVDPTPLEPAKPAIEKPIPAHAESTALATADEAPTR